MDDPREKVIKGLECVICPNRFCSDCLYFIRNENDPDTGWCNRDAIYKDALSLLKAQEPLAVRETGLNKCVCGNEINRYWHPEFCGFCGKKLEWF